MIDPAAPGGATREAERIVERALACAELTQADVEQRGFLTTLDWAVIRFELEYRIANLVSEPRVEADFCQGCGGRYRFDTSIDSVDWNAVIRANGLPEYLCAACIIREFASRGRSFDATLWGDRFSGTAISVRVVHEATARPDIGSDVPGGGAI